MQKRNNRRIGYIVGVSLPVLAAVASFASPVAALAQAKSTAEPAGVAEVVVTASRVERAGFIAPTPTTVVGVEQLRERAAVHVRDILYDLPQVVRASPGGTGSGNPGGQYVNLRNVGNLRTLVLVDGRRVVPTNVAGAVDLNVIPSSMISRMEIVTGGASAAWGSDAVSGVVNLILKDRIDGIEGSVQYNVTELGDNAGKSIELAGGHSFMDGRLRVMVAGEASTLEGVPDQDSRDWGKGKYAYILNPTSTATNGQARLIPTNNGSFSQMTAGGVINNTILRGTMFGPGGQPQQMVYGANVASLFQDGGSGGWLGNRTNIASPLDRNSVFGKVSYDVNESTRVFGEAMYAYSGTKYDIIVPYDSNAITVLRDNVFLPAQTRAIMVANNISSVSMGRVNYELGDDYSDGSYTTRRYVIGADGETAGWKWSTYYQYGLNTYNLKIGSRFEDNWRLGVDSVLDPRTGRAICRSTLTNPNNGCVPINIFGAGSIDAAAADYATGESFFTSSYVQQVVAADVRGELGSTWAGPISLAAGAEYRKESVRGESDPDSLARRYRLGNAQNIQGSETVKEVFAETVIPLAKDMPFASTLDLNAAIRYTDYRLAGPATTWKLGVTYQVNDDVRFRLTRSRDLAAPKLNQMFQPGSSGSGVSIDPFTNTQPRTVNITTGNEDLTPEAANTLTYGVVYSPNFVPGLQLSVDYYNIDISDAIGTLGTQEIINRCFAGATNLCPLIKRVNGVITEVRNPQLNFSNLVSQGIDFEASYGLDLSTLSESLAGRVNFRLLGTKIREISTDDGQTFVDRAGEVGNDLRLSGNATYRNGPLTLAGNFRYIGGGMIDSTYNTTVKDVADNHQGSEVYFGASAQYVIVENDKYEIQAFGRVDNPLNTDPPIMYSTGQQPTYTDGGLFDALGRRYAVGLRFKFR